MTIKKTDLEALVLTLLKTKREITLPEVALAAGLSRSDEGDRKAIRRVLQSLIKQGAIKAHGATRARKYIALLDSESRDVPIASPATIGYNQDFLRSYQPNQSFYLTAAERAELLENGSIEVSVRPAGTHARTILNRLLIDLSWNSSRLEGNTYSLLETKRLIELGETAHEKNAAETQMILNHKEAIEYLIESAEEETISAHRVHSVHALLSENLLGDPGASGRLRQISVRVSGTRYIPIENPHVLAECFGIFISKLNQILDPFEQSFFALVHLSYLQAFEDVNKRTARLVANIPFIRNNLRPLSFVDVDNDQYARSLLRVYEKNDLSLIRELYLRAYTRSARRYSAIQQSIGEPNPHKLKYRVEINEIIRSVILEKVPGPEVIRRIRTLVQEKNLPGSDAAEVLRLIETEIVSIHEGNIARFKIRPGEFEEWKRLQ